MLGHYIGHVSARHVKMLRYSGCLANRKRCRLFGSETRSVKQNIPDSDLMRQSFKLSQAPPHTFKNVLQRIFLNFIYRISNVFFDFIFYICKVLTK
ncbi:hypothetical protein SY86_19550 [Erwinia tracheiphila]|uniref:Uncharacterized protein n=1 Tax=Erwinia tracheiphila TaxID=65700 RepID=A0A0M2KJD2_9GAMM|nr:hypothetical protein AV903_21280 [Erwinia tracheiphila]EOS95361.1 hypothetical protein ETR_08806 [Erwinia tracheiphila PSU-1]KKF37111.1 hypothetical protein SY86_19550 [Erwinia tracheiphila]